METPPPEPPTRRNTRSALIEIPARLGALTVNDRGTTRVHANIMTNLMMDADELNRHLNLISPAPSPDELVIQARGRRRLPLTWSPPDIHYTPPGNRSRSPTKERTPVKQQSTIVTRSTPRKRLLMPDPHDISNDSPEKKASPNAKKVRIELPMPPFVGPIESALKALSPAQVIGVVQNILMRHPSLEDEIRKSLPAPDLRPIRERLHELKRNIYKSLPNSRLTSKTDSPAYNRAATHVLAFKKAIFDEGRNLVSSQQWESVIDYIILAWEQVNGTPLWDNPPHNTPRRQCYKFLASQCMSALKKSQNFTMEQLTVYHAKFQSFIIDSDDIQPCLKYLDEIKRK